MQSERKWTVVKQHHTNFVGICHISWKQQKGPLPFRGGSQAEKKNFKALDFLLEGILDSFKKIQRIKTSWWLNHPSEKY